MKRLDKSPLFAALLLTSVLCLSACLTGSGPGPDEPSADGWPDVVECVADKIPSAIDRITEALLAGDDPAEALVELAEVHGFDVVACGVSQLVDDWTSPGATMSPERMGAVNRARAFLDREQIDVKTVSQPSSSSTGLLNWIWFYPDTPRFGFFPIERVATADRPWHTLLAGARGVRS